MMNDPLTIYFVFLILFGILYLIIIFSYTVGWFGLKIFALKSDETKTTLSVIIPARNEEDNILNILNDLQKQNYPTGLFEVIIIDDHSADNTLNRVTGFIKNTDSPAVKIIRLESDKFSDTYKKHQRTSALSARSVSHSLFLTSSSVAQLK